MRVKARRGVCIGVERHMKPGDIEDLGDAALVTFLTGIGAVELVPEDPPPPPPPEETRVESESKPAPEKSGKKDK